MKAKYTIPKEKLSNNDEEKTIIDKYSATYIFFYAFGILTQLHSHFFITANDYWMYKFRDPQNETSVNSNSENRTTLQAQFTSLCTVVSSVSMIAFVAITVISAKWISIPKRITVALTVFISMFILTLVFVAADTDAWQKIFLIITLGSLLLLTAAGGIFLMTGIELVTRFPPEYLPAILSGQAVCGISSALIQIISLSVVDLSRKNAAVYFSIGLLFVIMTTVSYYFISKKNKFFKKHYQNVPEPIKKDQINITVIKSSFSKIKWYNFAMFVTLGTTIIVHPAVTSLVTSTHQNDGGSWENTYFVPVITFFLHHVFDLFGRELAVKIKQPENGIVILVVSILRIVFVPLLMFCNAQPRSHLPVVFGDMSYLALMAIFSFTNGYLINICVYNIPRQTTDPVEQKVAYLLLMINLMIGSGIFALMSVQLVNSL